MKKGFLLLALLVLTVMGCQNSAEPDSAKCDIKLSEMDFIDMTGLTYNAVIDEPFTGSLSGEEAIFDETGRLVLAKYASAEKADALLTEANIKAIFGADVTLLTDAPAVYGDNTVWLRLQENPIVDAALIRYSDYLLLASPTANTGIVKDMVETVDGIMLAYIEEYADCAYIHPDTR